MPTSVYSTADDKDDSDTGTALDDDKHALLGVELVSIVSAQSIGEINGESAPVVKVINSWIAFRTVLLWRMPSSGNQGERSKIIGMSVFCIVWVQFCCVRCECVFRVHRMIISQTGVTDECRVRVTVCLHHNGADEYHSHCAMCTPCSNHRIHCRSRLLL